MLNYDRGGAKEALYEGDTSVEVPSSISDHGPSRRRIERQAHRTIKLMNLSESTSHLDIVKAVRGGKLVDLYFRPHERFANVSFVHAADAQAFYNHVRKHDLYIRNKRVRAHPFRMPRTVVGAQC